MKNKKYDVEERLIQFSVDIIKICQKTVKNFASEHLVKQIIRSSTSSALNYGEALGAGTTKDRINKLRITLKELRESLRNLRIQSKANLLTSDKSSTLQSENDELIQIVVTLIKNSND